MSAQPQPPRQTMKQCNAQGCARPGNMHPLSDFKHATDTKATVCASMEGFQRCDCCKQLSQLVQSHGRIAYCSKPACIKYANSFSPKTAPDRGSTPSSSQQQAPQNPAAVLPRQLQPTKPPLPAPAQQRPSRSLNRVPPTAPAPVTRAPTWRELHEQYIALQTAVTQDIPRALGRPVKKVPIETWQERQRLAGAAFAQYTAFTDAQKAGADTTAHVQAYEISRKALYAIWDKDVWGAPALSMIPPRAPSASPPRSRAGTSTPRSQSPAKSASPSGSIRSRSARR